jgi:phosphatidylserine/phosphatidylglycerophosphate/cardiolipin synthase-like enzyme
MTRSRLALLALLAACAPPDETVAPLDLSDVPRSTEREFDEDGLMEVYFTEPGVEPGGESQVELDDALAAMIDAATSTVDMCLYEFKHPLVIDAAVAAVERGVHVRFVGDGDELEDSGYLALEAAGVEIVARAPRDRIMHNKFVVVDEQALWTGSTNATENGIFRNNNHAIIIESAAMAEEYTREFEQMYVGAEFGRKKDDVTITRSISFRDQDIQFHFSPEHDPIHEMVALADSADHTLHFMVFAYTHPDLLDAMLRAHARGVEVVGIFDESQARGRYSVDEQLAAAGVPVFIDGNKNSSGFAGGKLHHKVMLVDVGVESSDPVVTSGSFNWSKSATLYNDENLVELRDPALHSLYAQEFCRVLEVATQHPEYQAEPVNPCARVPQLFINEFLPNPDGTDRGQEFVEIVNVGATAVDLTGWTFGDEANPVRHTFSGTVIEPGDGVVLFDQGDHSAIPNAINSTTGSLSLNNTGDTLTLVDATGAVIDMVDYNSSSSGKSWNRKDDLGKDAPFTWHAEVEGAVAPISPGTRVDGTAFNFVPVPEFHVVINELLPNPIGTDRGQEYVELVNMGPDPADLTGFTVYDASGLRHDFGAVVLEVGEALVLFDEGDHSEVPGAINSSSGSLSLNNTGDVISLYDADGVLHDQVSWATSREGEAWNRAVDGLLGAGLDWHSNVAPDGALMSPGVRADGSPWD